LVILSCCVFVLPNFAFLILLHKRGCLIPARQVRVPANVNLMNADHIGKLFLNIIIIISCFFLNILMIILMPIIGMYMYTTKVMCIGGISNSWFRQWTNSDDHTIEEAIDTEILNESIYVEIVCETFPQVIIQIYNNYILDPNVLQWNPISLFSLSITFMNTINGIYRYVIVVRYCMFRF
jgi:hypothetical protein